MKPTMSASLIEQQRKKVQRMGLWAGVRYLRNQGFSFEEAHQIVLNRAPRKA